MDTDKFIGHLTCELDTMMQIKQHSSNYTFMGYPIEELIKSYEMIISAQIKARAVEKVMIEKIGTS